MDTNKLENYNQNLSTGINNELQDLSQNLGLNNLINFALATSIFSLSLFVLKKVFQKVEQYIDLNTDSISDLSFKDLVLIEASQFISSLKILKKVLKLLIFIGLLYFYLTYVFNIFPTTQGLALLLINYMAKLAQFIYKTTIGFIPNLLTISFIVLFTYYVLKLTKFIMKALFLEKLIFPGFKREWIFPTFDIAKFFIIIFAIIMIFPYLPGSNSPAFKGVSVFIGLLITMGAGSAIANIFAGIVMIYMSPFKVGDYVKVADISGKIIEMGLLVTRIKTIKNEQITITNSNILSKDIINYSASVDSEEKLILHINVGLGYDAPSELVENLLIESCKDYQFTLNDPSPFVNITSFEQSFINYELNVYVTDAHILPRIKSDIHKNILRKFNENSIEILSPEFINIKKQN